MLKESWEKVSRNRRRGNKTNILLAIICVLLVGLLGTILVMSKKTEQEEVTRLQELAQDQQTGIEDYESVKERAQQLEEAEDAEGTEDKSKNSKKLKTSEKKEKDLQSDTPEDSEEKKEKEESDQASREISGVVCWGDDLINGEESATYSYMSVLQKILSENGYPDLTVINKTLQGGGTLSMMKMAGVSDETLQGYITKHQQAANGAQLNVTETGIRDLTEEETARNDLDCIPIIFMGYYGGWNHDPAELAEQQEQILNTFPNKEQFIVVGTRPLDGTVTSEALDQVLSQKWGEHYISLAAATTYPSARYEAQQAMAEAIFAKLQELGYISPKQS